MHLVFVLPWEEWLTFGDIRTMLVQPLQITQTLFKDVEFLSDSRPFVTGLVTFCDDSMDLFLLKSENSIGAEDQRELLDQAVLDCENGNIVYEYLPGDL